MNGWYRLLVVATVVVTCHFGVALTPPGTTGAFAEGTGAAHGPDESLFPPELARRLPSPGFSDVTWQDPFPGQWKTVDVTKRGIEPGAGDVTEALQALVDGLGEPTILYFPPGTYRFSKISMRKGDLPENPQAGPTNNVIFRGAGPAKTLFKPPHDGTVFGLLGKGGWYEWPNLSEEWQPRKITADVPAGATTVPIASTKGLEVGDTVLVVEDLVEYSYKAAKRGRGGVFVVTKIEPGRITLNLPLAIGLEQVAERDGFVAKIDPARNVGFENFRVEMPAQKQKGRKGPIIHIKRSRNIYVKNVESFNPTGHHVMVAYSHRVVIRDCFFDEAKVKGEVDWGPLPADTRLPPSLYLKNRPSFWPEDLVWPPFGPDVSEWVKKKLPAQLRYEAR